MDLCAPPCSTSWGDIITKNCPEQPKMREGVRQGAPKNALEGTTTAWGGEVLRDRDMTPPAMAVPVGVGCPRRASEFCVVTTAVAVVPAPAEVLVSATAVVGK